MTPGILVSSTSHFLVTVALIWEQLESLRYCFVVKELRMRFKFLFLFTVQPQVRYLLEWTEEDLEDVEDAVSAADLEFCHPLCQCPKCAPAQKVWRCFC